jgi:hypothetical protein
MDNLFIKQVIGGKVVEIENVTIGKMLKSSLASKNLPEHEQLAYMMCAVTKVNGSYLNPREFLESTDIELFNFISESFTAMTNNNIF